MAGYVVNRIPLLGRTFTDGVSALWNATGTTLSASALVSVYGTEGSLAAEVSNGDVIYFNKSTSTNLAISNLISSNGTTEVGDSFAVGFWIKSDCALSLSLSVELLLPSQNGITLPKETKSEFASITSGEWTFIQLEERVTVPDDEHEYPISFNINIQDILGVPTTANINISHPIITASLDFVYNPMLLDIYRNIPEFYRNFDSLGAEAPYPWTLARFMEMCIIHQGEMRQILDDSIYADVSDGKNPDDPTTLSTLVDPSVAPRKNIFWLAQFSGTKIVNPTTGVTPWANLPATWQGIDNLDAVPSAEDSSPWDVIQDSDPEPAGLDEFLRWQVQYGYYGVNAGSKQAVIESVKRVLTGTKEVTYLQEVPWQIDVRTKKTETPDSSLIPLGDAVLGILELMEPSRPLGVKIFHALI